MKIKHILTKLEIRNLREILFDDVKDLIKDINIFKQIEESSTKVSLFKFIYNVDGLDVVGFISIPSNIDLTKKHKVIFALRGGSRDFGAIKLGYFYNEKSYFSWFSIDEEYITVSTQYRGNSGGTGVDEFGGGDLNDVKALYDLVKQINFCDSEKIGIFGWSRGAQMIYQLLKTENWIKSAICVAGPTNHKRAIDENFRPNWKDHLIEMFGGEQKEIERRSALYWSEKIKKIPILIIHGDNDDKVDVRDSIDLHKELPNSQIKVFSNDGHDLLKYRDKIKYLSLNWFKESL